MSNFAKAMETHLEARQDQREFMNQLYMFRNVLKSGDIKRINQIRINLICLMEGKLDEAIIRPLRTTVEDHNLAIFKAHIKVTINGQYGAANQNLNSIYGSMGNE